MTKREYMKRAQEAYNSGRISEETFDAMIMNANVFCDENEDDDFLPDTYAEPEYADFDNPGAVDGARFDDMNYLRYMER